VRIIDYEAHHQRDFKRLNVAWIEKSFIVEDVDLEVLDRPHENIIAPGGAILLAEEEGAVVGTCALVLIAPGEYQLVKMTVDERFRGKGIGRALCVATLQRARELGAKKVVLYSNKKGSSEAIALYRKLGFIERPLRTQAYARADIYMELAIGPAQS
jgi:ribosomal protein S18 acetylase RimI-like enzyme